MRLRKILNDLDEVKVISYFLAFVFISAGISKIIEVDNFRGILSSFNRLLGILTFPIIFSEIWVGFGLIFDGGRRIAMIFGLILLLTFTCFVLYQYSIGSRSKR